jgi:hypothetical protein
MSIELALLILGVLAAAIALVRAILALWQYFQRWMRRK